MTKIGMKTAWKLGVTAAREGQPMNSNPFMPGTQLFESWRDGWRMENSPVRQHEAKR